MRVSHNRAMANPDDSVAPARPVRLLGIGHVAVDHQFNLPDWPTLPSQPGKVAARRYGASVGGMTANACVAAARLGARVAFASPVGDDEDAERFRQHFVREGVDATGLLRIPGAASSVSAVLVDGRGERLIVTRRGDALLRAPELSATRLPAALAAADLLLTDARCPAWAEGALRLARAAGIASVLDVDTSPPEDLRRLVPLADWAVFSAPGLAAWAGQDTDAPAAEAQALAAALASGARVAAVTRGEAGVAWLRPGAAVQRLPACAVAPVVDTTGAGDVFHGALGVALAEGLADAEALRFAATAAALKCLKPDGVMGAPRRGEVLRRLAAAA